MAKKLGFKIWLLIILLAFSLLSIFWVPHMGQSGAVVKSVDENSTAYDSGFLKDQLIVSINGEEVNSLEDYSEKMNGLYPSEEKQRVTFQTSEGDEIIYYSDELPDIITEDISVTNLKAGLDLAGGSRALVQAKDKELDSKEADELADVLRQRLNVYGIEDVQITQATDLQGNNRIRVEIAGATPEDLDSLISEQGKFEAKIGNQTVFTGGERDISSVARNPPEAGVESCNQEEDGNYYCSFRFAVYLSQNAAEKHAKMTENLSINQSSCTGETCYLDQALDLYLDGSEVSSLRISEGLRGKVTTQISISGSGAGETRDEAHSKAQEEMKQLQTVLVTGSLPYDLEIVKLDTISPSLGNDFVKSILFAGLAALLMVSIVVFIRYRKLKPSVALLFTSISEIVIILGIAAMIEWNLDLPSIAGILATVGTGLDQQIIILDESQEKISLSLKQKMKRAFAIIMGAYFTAVVALLPLIWAGAGLLKGFAITTIIGISVGVLITRPAFSEMIKRFDK